MNLTNSFFQRPARSRTMQALLLGPTAVGKTQLKIALEALIGYQRGGYRIDVATVEEANSLRHGNAELQHGMDEGPLPSTHGFDTRNFSLFCGRDKVADLAIADIEGQILGETKLDSDEKQHRKLREVRRLGAEADVVIVVVSSPLGVCAGAQQLHEERLDSTVRNLRTILELREGRPVNTVVALSKLDGAFRSELDARTALTAVMTQELLRPLIDAAFDYQEVASLVVWPTSSWGFDGGAPFDWPVEPRGSDGRGRAYVEPQFRKKAGRPMRPFNVGEMVLDTFRAGLMLEPGADTAEHPTVQHIDRLADVLDACWKIKLKRWALVGSA